MANLKMVSPWIDFYHKTQAMFEQDKNVTVVFDEDETTLKLYVKEQEKAAAIEELLPGTVIFGNVTLGIKVYPGNGNIWAHSHGCTSTFDPESGEYVANLFKAAFHGNNALRYTHVVDGFMGFNATYIVFEKKVVQYHNDDIGDINGKRSTLYQEIAKEIFTPNPGVYYCTDAREDSCMPF